MSESDAAAIIASTNALTLAGTAPHTLDPDEVGTLVGYTNAAGMFHEIVDLERYAAHPRRKTATPTFTATESFAKYVNTHRADGTTLYVDPDVFSVVAILDDHAVDQPGHRTHRATLALERTPGCRRWLDAHAHYHSQLEFAQLIEDGLSEIASPDGATLLEVAQSITATKAASFRSDRRLNTGRVQFMWHEELDASAGASGELTIPETITLVFAPFYGAPDVQLDARFRYRLRDGKLTLGFWLIRHEETLRDAFAAEVDRISTLTWQLDLVAPSVLWGTP